MATSFGSSFLMIEETKCWTSKIVMLVTSWSVTFFAINSNPKNDTHNAFKQCSFFEIVNITEHISSKNLFRNRLTTTVAFLRIKKLVIIPFFFILCSYNNLWYTDTQNSKNIVLGSSSIYDTSSRQLKSSELLSIVFYSVN